MVTKKLKKVNTAQKRADILNVGMSMIGDSDSKKYKETIL